MLQASNVKISCVGPVANVFNAACQLCVSAMKGFPSCLYNLSSYHFVKVDSLRISSVMLKVIPLLDQVDFLLCG